MPDEWPQHPLDREVGLAGVGRAKHRAHPIIRRAAISRCGGTGMGGEGHGPAVVSGLAGRSKAAHEPRRGIRETTYRTRDAFGRWLTADFTLIGGRKCDKAEARHAGDGCGSRGNDVGPCAHLSDLPEAEDGPAEGPSSPVDPTPALDPETARGLLPYLRNSQKLAQPGPAQEARRKVVARVNGFQRTP